MQSVLQDLTFALRRIRKNPGFTILAILTLALAIGANTTVFSAVNALLLRPLPVIDHPEQLVFFTSGAAGTNQSYPNYRDIRERTKTLSGVAAIRIAPMSVARGEKAVRLWGYEATGNYFQVLGIHPALGRFFTPSEDVKPGANPYAILSYDCWQNRFGADRDIVNKLIAIDGLKYTVLGVAPKGFIGTERLLAPDLWVPMSMEAQLESGNDWLNVYSTYDIWVFGRLKSGVPLKKVQSEIDDITAQLIREHPLQNEGLRIRLTKIGLIGESFRGSITAFSTVILCVAGLVLLIACTNLASSLLAQSADRKRETAIRIALGAGRLRLVRQLLTENTILALGGGAVGILLTYWLIDAFTSTSLPVDFPIRKGAGASVDFHVLCFELAVSLFTVLLFGLAPALATTRPNVLPALKNETWSQRLRRFEVRDLLVVGQITLSVVLLVGSILVVRSLQNALTVDVGYNPRNAASVSFDLGMQGYDEAHGLAFQKRLLERAQNLPGIESASLSNTIPLSMDVSTTTVTGYGQPEQRHSDKIHAVYYFAGPNFFSTLQTKLMEGRGFTWRDNANSPRVVVVNNSLAHRLFPHENALGKRLSQGSGQGPWYQIVGIVEDGKYESLNDENKPAMFWSLLQRYTPTATLVARSHLPTGQIVSVLRQTLKQMEPAMPLYAVGSLEDYLKFPTSPARLAAEALGSFGFLAVALATIGVYGAMSYAVARRTREIGIRVAIGAKPRDILNLVLRRTVVIVGIGMVAGLVAAFATGHFFAAVLYGVSPRDPVTYLAAVALMSLVAIAACVFPTRRALTIDPVRALREE